MLPLLVATVALAIVATVIGVVVALLGYEYYDSHTSFPPCTVNGTAPSPYVIADIVQSTDIALEGKTVVAENRHAYALWIRNAFREPGNDFREWYEVKKSDGIRSNRENAHDFWLPVLRSGNWREGFLSTDQDYPVYAQGPLGSTIIVTSGADYRMPLPIPRRELSGLGENEDFWSYRNLEGDTICRITFVITSRDVALALIAVEERFGDVVIEETPSIGIAVSSPQGHTEHTLRVAWTTPLLPGHTRTVRYRMTPPPDEPPLDEP